jgi:hypothetical protein
LSVVRRQGEVVRLGDSHVGSRHRIGHAAGHTYNALAAYFGVTAGRA